MITDFQINRKLCVAPMMAWTDRHCRYLHRLVAPRALLFTEMVTSSALIHGPRERLLRFDAAEHPVALQLGGSDPGELGAAARLAADAGFDEVNLNVGCPSPRVRQGRFGACLMREPELVGRCIAAMAAAVDVPVTVKCRLGVDDYDSQPLLEGFVDALAAAGCRTFYVHARKALLNGLSPAQNRTVPPLQYDRAYALKARFPELEFVLNGGIDSVDALSRHLAVMDGVMVGRAAYQRPMLLGEMDAWVAGEESRSRDRSHRESRSRDRSHRESRSGDRSHEVMGAYRAYIVAELESGTRLADMTRHALGLFAGLPGARRFRRILSDSRRLRTNDPAVVDDALAALAGAQRPARAA